MISGWIGGGSKGKNQDLSQKGLASVVVSRLIRVAVTTTEKSWPH